MTGQAARTGGLKLKGDATLAAVARSRTRSRNDLEKKNTWHRHLVAVALIVLGTLFVASSVALGAVWTTDIHGVTQDANGYDKRCDVYVNASGIPLVSSSDDLYVQVTDTSGVGVLSHDPTIFVVPNSQLIVTYDSKGNPYGEFSGQGPICPYDESTNGIYKVKVSADPAFPNSNTFTDNFSVRLGDPGISKTCYTLVPSSIQQLAYTIEVINTGGEALGVAVEDVLPSVLSNATYTLDSTLMGDWPVSNVVDLGTVDADAIHVLEIYVDVPASLSSIGSNTATVSSTSIDDNTGDNSSTCTNSIAVDPSLMIQKATNGEDADTAPGPSIEVGDIVNWTYVVTNPGNVPLENIIVTDDQGITPTYETGDTDGDGELDIDETWIYTATGAATPGQYTNIGTATGEYAGTPYTDEDLSHYVGEYRQAKIDLTPGTATNEVGEEHLFTATVSVWNGTTWVTAPDGTLVDFAIVSDTTGVATVSRHSLSRTLT